MFKNTDLKDRVLLKSCTVLFFAFVQACAFGQALPDAFRAFRDHETSPVFTGREGRWDAVIRERGWVMKEDGQFRMWFTGYPSATNRSHMNLGYAVSKDGLNWQRTDEPLLPDVYVEDMMVVKHEGTYFMFAEGQHDQAQLLTSPDGIDWKRVGALDVRLTSGEKIPEGPYGTPTAFFNNGQWHLFYERRDQGVWLATSRDMKIWTNVSDQPLIVPGPDSYDRLMIAMNQVIAYDGRFYAVMHGTGTPTKPRQWCTYLAVSEDLHSWKKCTDGPVLPVSDNKSSGLLVHDGTRFRLYTMHGKVDVHFAKQNSASNNNAR